MTGAECARTASDLTRLVRRMQRCAETLHRQSRLTEDEFGGLSGDAFRRHAARSRDTAFRAAAEVALLAGALAALGRGLDSAARLRQRAAASPSQATQWEQAAARVTERAQREWLSAVAAYGGPGDGPVVVPGTVLHPTPAHPPTDPPTGQTGRRDPPLPVAPAPTPETIPETTPETTPGPTPAPVAASAVLTSSWVSPPLVSELVTPPAPSCGTAQAVSEARPGPGPP